MSHSRQRGRPLFHVAATVTAGAFTVPAHHLAAPHDVIVLTALQMPGGLLVAAPGAPRARPERRRRWSRNTLTALGTAV